MEETKRSKGEALARLIRAISEDRTIPQDERNDYIDDIVGERGLIASMCDYSNTVITGSYRVMAMRLRYEGDGDRIRYFTEQMDHARRLAHEGLCTKLSIINKYSQHFLGETFYDKPIVIENGHYTRESRRYAAEFAADFLDEEFRKGIRGYSRALESGVPDARAMEGNTISDMEETEYTKNLEEGEEPER